MKKTICLILGLALILGLCCSGYASAEASPDWVGRLPQAQDAGQLLIVAAVGETTAYISMHEKDAGGVWQEIMTTPGFVGRHGLGKVKEGDGMTPIGNYRFNRAFGIAADPGCAIPYYQVDDLDYWSGDQRDGFHYNELVSLRDCPDLNVEDSEHIVDYVNQYQYCLNISYNEECIPGRGSAIFLHCLGPQKPYTGGCVAIPKDKMLTVMQNVRPDCAVVIDSLRYLSPELWDAWGLEPQEEPQIAGALSAIYTQEDMDEAVRLILETFDTWEGCELHSIDYYGDACNSPENIRWLNELGDGQQFSEVIAFVSSFHSPVEGGGAWEPDTEYTGWEWWLAREFGGSWQLMTWGY